MPDLGKVQSLTLCGQPPALESVVAVTGPTNGDLNEDLNENIADTVCHGCPACLGREFRAGGRRLPPRREHTGIAISPTIGVAIITAMAIPVAAFAPGTTTGPGTNTTTTMRLGLFITTGHRTIIRHRTITGMNTIDTMTITTVVI
ncbi:MAG: hypothetical protein IPK48_03460 [Gammaproteobacteria bacterium]|nr:hypothetical protein [Gammaproteobacteria bacterium]